MKNPDSQLLTHEQIYKDIKSLYFYYKDFSMFFFFAVFLALSYFLSILIKWPPFFPLIISLPTLVVLSEWIFRVIFVILAKNGKVKIVEDVLVNFAGKEAVQSPFRTYKPFTLWFLKHKKYLLSESPYYKFSLDKPMSRVEICEKAEVGDKFILILVGKRIIYVYNKKLFHKEN